MATTKPQTTNGLTSSGSGSGNSASNSSDYQTLMNEIKQTIDKNDMLFKQIEQANYPDAGTYTSDLLNYKIDTQISDLTKARQQIWDYLNKKYIENTKLRSYYFNELRKADEHLAMLTDQQQTLIDSIQNKNIKNSTAIESIKQEKYVFDKKQYYLFLYKILVFVQISIMATITLCLTGIIPRTTCLIITVILLIATAAFVGYYVFFVNIGRNMFSWTKFEHDAANISNSSQCLDSSVLSPADKQKAIADKAVDNIIKQNASSCDVSS
jgi:hypothetical protein